MPGKDVAADVGPASSPDLSLFKTHKMLPKRTAFPADIVAASLPTSRTRKHDLEREGYSSSERIRSWIPEPSSVQTVPDHSLPLTPPPNATEKLNGLRRMESPGYGAIVPYASSCTASSGLTTPVLKRSPPTPETTPPKIDRHPHMSPELSNPRLPSTRAESFETARENLTADDESSQPESPSLRPSRQRWLRSAGHTTSRGVGLGLGLESDDGERTPTEVAPKMTPEEEELVSFDGAWNGATPEMDAVRGGADLAYRAEMRKRLPERPRISDQLLETPLINERDSPLSVTRSLSLRERVDQTRQTPPRASTEDFADKIRWPLQGEDLDLEEKLREVDNRRFSQISTTSTTVEAVILNTPPQRRRTLRHSSKFTDLNSASLQSERKVSSANDRGQQRLLRHATNPDGGQRGSSVSGTNGEGRTISSRRRQDVRSVIVAPNPIPSLSSKSPYIPSPRGIKTLTYAWQQSSRPTTAPEDAVGYFDIPQPGRRVASAYVPISPPKERKPYVEEAPTANVPNHPVPSASVTRNISRANSNGSTAKDSISPPTGQRNSTGHRFHDSLNTGFVSPDEGSNGDWTALRPRSSLVTPFSLRSARSSTPGTLEVNEATAISIYPHTNKSILVVQHAPRRNSQPAEHSAIIASNAKFAIPAGSVQPPFIHEPRQLLNSPLQNPRSPPQPPGFKVIPPTPVNMTDVSSPERQQARPSEQEPKGRFSNRVKRAFSTRRYSDAFVAPITRSLSLSRRNTVTGARRASTGIDLERNLHPFWRPRAFWDKDDESDSDSDFGNDGFLVGNSLGMPSEGVKTFEPPRRRGSLSHRFGSLRLPRRRGSESATRHHHHDFFLEDEILPDPTPVRKATTTKSLGLRRRTRKLYGRGKDDNESYEFIQPRHAQEYVDNGENNGVPRLGYQVQFVPLGFKGLAEKVKERREEARREKVRERLRGSIDVLRAI
ncbi:MAG: hypothetical protein L6R39_003731 [Caloplaca ligustica]|nr:MAG: hypothetical protein L6R39_003731 [Caloplaca ligustica]